MALTLVVGRNGTGVGGEGIRMPNETHEQLTRTGQPEALTLPLSSGSPTDDISDPMRKMFSSMMPKEPPTLSLISSRLPARTLGVLSWPWQCPAMNTMTIYEDVVFLSMAASENPVTQH